MISINILPSSHLLRLIACKTRLRTFFPILIFLTTIAINLSHIEIAAAQPPSPAPFNYTEFTIKNGLHVILLPNHRLPVITHNLIYMAGAAHEKDDEHGAAHYLEHLMFQGTKKFPKGIYDKLISSNGGYHNASTGHDVTIYKALIPRKILPTLMELEADRMTNLDVLEKDITREREVVEQEYRNRLNSPSYKHRRKLYKTIYKNHPYSRLISGTEKEIKNLNRSKAIAFYKRYYNPATAILVLSGDITEKDARKLVNKTYGKIPAIPKIPDTIPPLPKQTGNRIVSQHTRISKAYISRTYLLPPPGKLTQKQIAALNIFMSLSESYTGQSYDRLVRKSKIAASFGSSVTLYRYASEVSFQASAGLNIPAPTLEEAFNNELKKILSTPLNEQEFKDYKQSMIAVRAYRDDNRSGLAAAITNNIRDGLSAEWLEKYDRTLEEITQEEVYRIATSLLNNRPYTTDIIKPEKDNKKTNQRVDTNNLIQRVISPGGIEAWLNESHHAKTISMRFSFKGGAWHEPEDKSGLAAMASYLFSDGAGNYDTIQLSKEKRKIAAGFGASSGSEYFTIRFSTPMAHLHRGVELLKLALFQPRISQVSLELARQSMISSQKSSRLSPASIKSKYINQKLLKHKQLWRPGHGTLESISSITTEDIIKFRERIFTRDSLKISVSGAITPAELMPLLDNLLGHLPEKSDLPKIPIPPSTKKLHKHLEMDIPQSRTTFANLFPIVKSDRKKISISIANHILGSTPTGRLFQQLREKQGLVYGINTYLSGSDSIEKFYVSFSSAPDKTDKVKAAVTKALEEFVNQGPSAEELENAKSSFMGSFYLQLEGNGRMASRLLGMQINNRPITYLANYTELVKSITLKDVKQAARHFIKPENMIIVTIGKSPDKKTAPQKAGKEK